MGKIFVTKPSIPTYEEYIEEIKSIWDTMHVTNFGPQYNKFIEAIQDRYNYEYVDFQCNGHMSLQNILSCIEPGEVITTPFTFISTTLAIKNAGHTPVFCDIKLDDYNIDPDKIEELITDKTVAIVPVHVYGSPCEVEKIQEIADKHGLKVVYDAAHAFNVKYKGTDIGCFGDGAMFSLHATKVFNSIEGGMIVVKTKEWLDEVISRSNFGISDALTVYDGVNSKMNEFSASMGLVNLKHLDKDIERRKELTEMYDERLKDVEGLTIFKRRDDVEYNYAYYPVLIDKEGVDGGDFVEELEKSDVYCRRYFYPAANEMPLFKGMGNTPIAHNVSLNIVCLPIYADLKDEELEMICGLVKDYMSK